MYGVLVEEIRSTKFMVTAEANGRRTTRARCATIGEEELFKMGRYASRSSQIAKIEIVLDQILARGKNHLLFFFINDDISYK